MRMTLFPGALAKTRKENFMEEMADVNVMYELLKSCDEISAIEKLLNEF